MEYKNIRKLLKAFDDAKNGEAVEIPVGALSLLDKLERKLKYFHHSKTIITSIPSPEIEDKMKIYCCCCGKNREMAKGVKGVRTVAGRFIGLLEVKIELNQPVCAKCRETALDAAIKAICSPEIHK